ncbi:hypothetical protein K438DRAFT_1806248 [Mycena galopus ATCC 62051]|nr:hypothetical protein K438DRAFT_1806248 [Mycena galopus ATCC 62051]
MFPALSQLISRTACRSFASRAAIFNNFSPATSARRVHERPRVPNPYTDLSIGTPSHPQSAPATGSTWNNNPITAHVAGTTKAPATPEDIWRERSKNTVATLQKLYIANPYSGRSVKVRTGKFAEAVREFEKILSRNSVRSTYRRAERHEKKGPKRRRIRSEQWRKHFAHQVRKNVQLVHKIRRRGV